MEKVKIIGFALLCGLILTACGDINNSASSTNKTTEKITQSKQSEETEKTTSEDSPNETSTLANLDTAIEKLKTGNITEISGSDFIVGEDIDPGRYIISPKKDTNVPLRIYDNEERSLLYQLGNELKDLKVFKLETGNRISLANKSDIVEAELLDDNFSKLSKGETAYVSGSETIVGEDLASGIYTIRPIDDEKIQLRIYHYDGNSQLYTLGEEQKELKDFKLAKGDKIKLAIKSDILALTRTK